MSSLKNNAKKKINRLATKTIYLSNDLGDWSRKVAIRAEDDKTAQWRARQAKWYKDNGDKTHRINYPLKSNSIVFDVGGYHGGWAVDIYCLYGSEIYIFEPVSAFNKIIKEKFGNNPSIHIIDAGLSSENSSGVIHVAEGASSVFHGDGNSEKIKLIKASDYLKEKKIKHIDLLKINIEGGEYDLLEHLIDIDFVTKVKDIQVQFHDFVPDADKRMKVIQEKLSETHKLTYHYPWVWDNWRLKDKGSKPKR